MNEDPSLSTPTIKDKTPWTIMLLGITAVIFASYQFYKFAQVLIHWKTLTGLGLRVPPVYLALAGLVWGLAGSLAAWSIWSKAKWSPAYSTLLGVVYIILFWVDRVFLSLPENYSKRWPANLVFTILGFGALMLILNLKSTQNYFGKNTVKIP